MPKPVTIEQLIEEIAKELENRAKLVEGINRIDGRISGYQSVIAHISGDTPAPDAPAEGKPANRQARRAATSVTKKAAKKPAKK